MIEEEFKKLYDKDEEFRNNFGEQAFELGPLQKYQVLDAYNRNGMQAVMALLLANSADQSAIMNQLEPGQSDIDLAAGVDSSIVEHNGKKY